MTRSVGFRSTPGPILSSAGTILFFAALVCAEVQGAQQKPPNADRQPGARRERMQPPPPFLPELRDETFRLMDAYFLSNLQESLVLTDEQFVKVLPLVKKLQSDRRESARRRMEAIRALRKTLMAGAVTETAVADLLKDVNTAAMDERASSVRNTEALDLVLTPIQQAKYRVFEAEVDVRLRQLLARSQARDRPANR